MDTKTRMQTYRAKLRKQGLRPVQVWVPDQSTPGFRQKLKRQIMKLDPEDESDALAFIENVTDRSER